MKQVLVWRNVLYIEQQYYVCIRGTTIRYMCTLNLYASGVWYYMVSKIGQTYEYCTRENFGEGKFWLTI